MNIKNRLLDNIYNSLKTEPERWTFGKYEASCGQITIWMCNRYYATHFNVGSIEIGGSNFWWIFKPWEWWRVKLIKAVEEAQFKFQFKE